MNVYYSYGTHLEQPVMDEAGTVDYLSDSHSGYTNLQPATKSFYVHPATSGYVVELDTGAVIDLSA